MKFESILDQFGFDYDNKVPISFEVDRQLERDPSLMMFVCPYEKIPVYKIGDDYQLCPKGSVDTSIFNNDTIYGYIQISYSCINSKGFLLNPLVTFMYKEAYDDYPPVAIPTDPLIVAYSGDVGKWDFKYVMVLCEVLKKQIADKFGLVLNNYLNIHNHSPMEPIDWGLHNAPNIHSGMYDMVMFPKFNDLNTCRLDNIHEHHKVSIIDDQIVVKPIKRRKEGKIKMSSKVRRICPNCGETFYTNRSDINRGKGVFCSRTCSNEYRSNHYTPYEFECKHCKIHFTTYDDDNVCCCIECENLYTKEDIDTKSDK